MNLLRESAVKRLIRKSGFRCGTHFETALNAKVIMLISQAFHRAVKENRQTVYSRDLSTQTIPPAEWDRVLEAIYERTKK